MQPFGYILALSIQCYREENEEKVARLHPSGESCGGIFRYLKVWCIAKGLRGRTEASCTIGQVSYCLPGEGALDDVRVIAILLQAGGSYTYTWLHTRMHVNKTLGH